jgi:parvulin-like peptidyl-prolyl isomerase
MRAAGLGFLLGLCCLAPACQPPPDPLQDLPPIEGLEADPARMPVAPAVAPERVSVSQILTAYRGAEKAYKKITLDREHARIRADRLLVLARAKGSDFGKLAREFSNDGKTSGVGGDMRTVERGQLHPDLERAAFGLEIGQVSDVVETPRGFHILSRHEPNEAQAAEIVITYTGAKRYTPRVPRDREGAKALAEQIHAQVLAGADFGEMAKAHSDLPNYEREGIFPVFRKGTRNEKFEEIVWNLPVDGLSEVEETPTGFHIVKRLPVRRIQVRAIRISFRGDEVESDLPSREEAQQLATRIHDQLEQDNEDFAWLASLHSDGDGKSKGGLMQPFDRGRIPYEIEREAFSLSIGEISGVFEAQSGFNILKRIR